MGSLAPAPVAHALMGHLLFTIYSIFLFFSISFVVKISWISMQIIDQVVPGLCNGPQVSVARTSLPGSWKLMGHFQCALDHVDSEHTGNCRCNVCFQCALAMPLEAQVEREAL